jgi:hypothetical protein
MKERRKERYSHGMRGCMKKKQREILLEITLMNKTICLIDLLAAPF